MEMKSQLHNQWIKGKLTWVVIRMLMPMLVWYEDGLDSKTNVDDENEIDIDDVETSDKEWETTTVKINECKRHKDVKQANVEATTAWKDLTHKYTWFQSECEHFEEEINTGGESGMIFLVY